jgi:hypothetical protein
MPIEITGKKARKLSKKKDRLERLQKAPERTSQKEGSHNLNFTGISVHHRMALLHGGEI